MDGGEQTDLRLHRSDFVALPLEDTKGLNHYGLTTASETQPAKEPVAPPVIGQ
jgi:hypothetical protein